jgi:hypothetical protein
MEGSGIPLWTTARSSDGLQVLPMSQVRGVLGVASCRARSPQQLQDMSHSTLHPQKDPIPNCPQ